MPLLAASPSVSNVQISGDAVEGCIIRGLGKYFGGKEGPSKFEWLREDKDSGLVSIALSFFRDKLRISLFSLITLYLGTFNYDWTRLVGMAIYRLFLISVCKPVSSDFLLVGES